ncbi:MAG: DegT/DnrJ/EryC1/StrS family aminotransferase [Candidatus Daviesbacteria bacterium]|nr:DegT/DnrJ/EryC1/StrS family aminotransferase [Candidatus Daviesbacteria bacterium]
MSIFNSLGSNYNFDFVLKALFTRSQKKDSDNLKNLLEEKYQGEAFLFYKGREAITSALKSLNLPKESFVAINGFTCFAVYEAIQKAGLNVEYLDIEKGELNFSPKILLNKFKDNPKIKVVIVQNTLGYPSDIEEIVKICTENKIILIEDLAHCVGTKYQNGWEAGKVGDITVLSFSQDKTIDGVSGGGLIVREGNNSKHNLNNLPTRQQLIDRLYPLFTYLIRTCYYLGVGRILHFLLKNLNLLSKPMGNKSNNNPHTLPDWNANLISLGFDNLNANLHHRKTIAYIYAKLISHKILSRDIVKQIPLSTNLRFPIFVSNRQSLFKFLSNHQIYVSDTWYDAPIAPIKYLKDTNYQAGDCPNSEMASRSIINLPTHINVSEADAKKIAQLINQWAKS